MRRRRKSHCALEMTRWPRYLKGYSFGKVAPLASPANPTSEPILVEFSNSLDRIVEEAHSSTKSTFSTKRESTPFRRDELLNGR